MVPSPGTADCTNVLRSVAHSFQHGKTFEDVFHIKRHIRQPQAVAAVMGGRGGYTGMFLAHLCAAHVCLCTRIEDRKNVRVASVRFIILCTLRSPILCKHQVYDEHYKLAIYVTPSRCDDEVCNSARIRLPAAETLPCRQPLDMPEGFLDSSVPKNQTLNFTIFAMEDVLLKVRN